MINMKFNNHPELGISACLLGEKVRLDGQHKLDRYLRDNIEPLVEWVPVGPEVECGLPIPRESMQLVGNPEKPRLETIFTKNDHTTRMRNWINSNLEELEKENLCGFIFKTKSPSCGMRNIIVYSEKGK